MSSEQSLRRYLAAYERKDIDAIADMLAPDVQLHDWNLQACGREQVLAETRKNFEAAETLQIEIHRVIASAHHAAAQLRIVVNGEITLEAMDVLSFDATGRITSIRAYKG